MEKKCVVKGMSEGSGGFSPNSEEVFSLVSCLKRKTKSRDDEQTDSQVSCGELIAGHVICEESLMEMCVVQ